MIWTHTARRRGVVAITLYNVGRQVLVSYNTL